MFIHQDHLKCVAFLLVDAQDKDSGAIVRVPVGTAFLVAIQHDETHGFVYAVTARHVIEGTRPVGRLSVRFNNAHGAGFTDFWAPHDTWTLHPNSDVAVAPLNILRSEFDVRYIVSEGLMTDDDVARLDVKEGDEVLFMGLFSQHFGEHRSLPVCRFGNIALMPHEPVHVTITPRTAPVPIDAYLVEARSWGGQSGSPAFVDFGLFRVEAEADIGKRLLGLVHGHFDIKKDVAFLGDVMATGAVPINAGMAIVVPATKILEALMDDELAEEREERVKNKKKAANQERAATPDLNLEDVEDYKREDFLRDLTKVTRRLDEPESPGRGKA